MRVAFRTDASALIGTGHLIRCRTLAQEMRARSADVVFVTRGHPGHLADLLRADGFETALLPAPQKPQDDGFYASWLGVSEEQDAVETIAALGSDIPEWLVVDHYALGTEWERRLKQHCGQLLAIDDLGRLHVGSLLLDQNFSAQGEARYASNDANAKRLLGPRYALLQAEYAEARARLRPKQHSVKRISIFFGGTDPANMTMLALEALDAPRFKDIALDVIAGSSHLQFAAIKAHEAAHPNVTVHTGLQSLAGIFAVSDLSLGAGGGALWERCCLGTPSIVVSIASNQVSASRDLDAVGVIRYLGAAAELSITTLRKAIVELAADSAGRQSMSDQGRQLVDGLGVKRVAEVMIPTSLTELTLRPAVQADCGYFFDLANDPAVRLQSFSQDTISWVSHCTWFEVKLRSASSRLFILEARGLPVGQIRFDDIQGDAVLSYALDGLVRGRGWGKVIINLGLSAIFEVGVSRVRAEVKPENLASCRIFEKAGFQLVSAASTDKNLYLIDQTAFAAHNPSQVQ